MDIFEPVPSRINSTNKKVWIVGYYHRNNLGDDIFEFILDHYFKSTYIQVDATFKNIDTLVKIDEDVDVVLFGGGDLINDYFMKKLWKISKDHIYPCPIYAIGVGIPYPSLIDQGYLEDFDFIIHRNKKHTVSFNMCEASSSTVFPWDSLQKNTVSIKYFVTNIIRSLKLVD